MLYALFGILAGVILGALLPLNIPLEYSNYSAVVILVVLDAIIHAICAQTKKEFQLNSFIFGMLFYIVIAGFFVYLGDKLNIDLYLGIVVVFVFRIIQNVGILRDFYFKKLFKKEKETTLEY